MSEDDDRTTGAPDEDRAEQPERPRKEAEPVDPKEAFVQGMGLLFHAARGAFGGLKKEIEKADIPQGLRSAAEEMKRAADAAIQGKPREPEPEWVQQPQGARIATDDEPPEPSAAEERPAGEGEDAGDDEPAPDAGEGSDRDPV